MILSSGKIIRTVSELDLKNRSVFLRLDLNVPLKKQDDGTWRVDDDNRILEALETIQYCLKQEARIVIGTHLGRPDGQRRPEFSLEPVATHLATLLQKEITLSEGVCDESTRLMVQTLRSSQILMLENLRFEAGEEKNDPDFSHRLAELCDVYVADAFGTAHRKHASTYGVPALKSEKAIGFLIEKEIKYLDQLLHKPAHPFFLIMGGAKVSDKIKTVENLLNTVDGIIIGGAMAYAFVAATNGPIPPQAKKPSPEDVAAAARILKLARARDLRIVLPDDSIDSFDIGPVTVDRFQTALQDAKTIFWNGPLGWFENPLYQRGTEQIARALGALPALKIVGGGDTVSAVKKFHLEAAFSHLSTGGGAALEYLEGRGLPGIDILAQPTKGKA